MNSKRCAKRNQETRGTDNGLRQEESKDKTKRLHKGEEIMAKKKIKKQGYPPLYEVDLMSFEEMDFQKPSFMNRPPIKGYPFGEGIPKQVAPIGVEELLMLLEDVQSGETHMHEDLKAHTGDHQRTSTDSALFSRSRENDNMEVNEEKMARQLLTKADVLDPQSRRFDNFRIPQLSLGDTPLEPEQVQAIHMVEDILGGNGSPEMIQALRQLLKEGGY